ncbi:MAG: polyphenol oxidase family protein, partial [Gemmatimonadota bacterium]
MTIAVPKGTEPVAIAVPGIVAFTTTRARGDFNVLGDRPSGDVLQRWLTLQDELGVTRFGYAKQVHGNRVVVHNAGWTGWLRVPDADGHLTNTPSTALAVTLADCVPIFLSHASGMIGLLHAGWRGTSAGIVGRAIEELRFRGVPAHELSAHLGPAICGKCYEVGPEVIAAVLRRHVASPQPLDLR